ncbi:hypothetical protein DFQ26_007125, partial [Actinomortierella ambigua]
MATYKQRVPVQRLRSGRHSPDHSKGSTVLGASGQYAHQATSQHQYFSAHQSLSSVYHNPDDDILDNALDQEWTSVRRSTDAESRAAYRRRMLEQRIQDWHLVLDQHRLNSSYQSDSSAEEEGKGEENKETADPLPPTIATSNSGDPPSVTASPRPPPVNTSIPITTSIAQSVIASPSAATHTSGSHFAFSDLASDSIGDESEDLEPWSPDDDDTLSTISRHRRLSLCVGGGGVVPSSPTASQSSITSFGQLPHPSFYHAGGAYGANMSSPALRFQNRMPFHDGSGNFITHRLQSRSHTGSELDSDYGGGGWESAVSSSKVRSVSSSSTTTRRIKRGGGGGGPITAGDFESMLQSIASLQALPQQQQQQQPQAQLPPPPHDHHNGHEQLSTTPRPYTFRPLARDGLSMRSRWPRSPSVASNASSEVRGARGARLAQQQHHHHQRQQGQQQYAPTPQRPSLLQLQQKTFKSYDSDNEDLSQLVATIPSSKTGWLQAFEQTLQSLNVKHASSELNLNEPSCALNPILVLAQHPTEEGPSDLTGLAKTLVPEEVFAMAQRREEEGEEEEGLRSMNATPTPASMMRKVVVAAANSKEEEVEEGGGGGGKRVSSPSSLEEQATTLRKVQKHISASSLETLQRLQDRQRAADYRERPPLPPSAYADRQGRRSRRRSSVGSSASRASVVSSGSRDPMHRIEFMPTLLVGREQQPMVDGGNAGGGGQACGDEYEGSSDSTLFRAFVSTLRRFRDHVKANLLLPPELDEPYLSLLRFEHSDLGIEWATEGGGAATSLPARLLLSHQTTTATSVPEALVDGAESLQHSGRRRRAGLSGDRGREGGGSGSSCGSRSGARSHRHRHHHHHHQGLGQSGMA